MSSPSVYGKEISWMDNYPQAIKLAQEKSKPIVLFFTGSDWCAWCVKLEKEVFESTEFTTEIDDKLIFVKLDYPMKKQLEAKLKEQNEKLKARFYIRSFPTVIILSPDEKTIGITGYRAGGGKQYAEHIMKMVNEYSVYKKQMSFLDTGKLSGKELKRLYQKSNELDLNDDATAIIKEGINSDQKQFFLTEKYRQLVCDGKIYESDSSALKRYILDNDADNKHLTHYQVAVIDFEAYSEDLEKGKCTADFAVSPLAEYVCKFSETDKENMWRLNMVISQVYLDKNMLNKALEFAKNSYTEAPSTIKTDIAMAIENIEKQISINN